MGSDTIVARATPAGKAGVSVVRLSGSKAKSIAAILSKKNLTPRLASYSKLYDSNDVYLDEGILLLFEGPHSFTGEDVVECQIHGNPLIEDALIKTAVHLGARLAEPGEFSKRAFLNGKMDLAQAEALCDLIHASSETALKAAQRSLQGEFSKQIDALAKALRLIRMELEAYLDFPEEVEAAHEKLHRELQTFIQALQTLLQKAKNSVRLQEGIKVALVGAPNVGKSSLLNALVEEDAAIVSHIPGTTRDVIERTILVEGCQVLLFDTAGLRESNDPIEQEGIRRTQARLAQADVVWYLQDAMQTESDAVASIDISHLACVHVVNKIDCLTEAQRKHLPEGPIYISAKTGEGLALLKQSLFKGREKIDENAFLARTRHVLALELAFSKMQNAAQAFQSNNYLEVVAEECRQAHESLFEIIGKITSDELLGDIFSAFCIGK